MAKNLQIISFNNIIFLNVWLLSVPYEVIKLNEELN